MEARSQTSGLDDSELVLLVAQGWGLGPASLPKDRLRWNPLALPASPCAVTALVARHRTAGLQGSIQCLLGDGGQWVVVVVKSPNPRWAVSGWVIGRKVIFSQETWVLGSV